MAKGRKAIREKCIAEIGDKIIDFRTKYNGRNPEYVYMTTALFKIIAGSTKADKERSKFGIVNG